ncbi:MAG: PLP-dependent transferase [Bacteroidia bacterium]
MTHTSVPREKESAVGHTGLIRLSCGLEDADDLIQDLEQALAKVSVNAIRFLGFLMQEKAARIDAKLAKARIIAFP